MGARNDRAGKETRLESFFAIRGNDDFDNCILFDSDISLSI
jgi:hypothetical protein